MGLNGADRAIVQLQGYCAVRLLHGGNLGKDIVGLYVDLLTEIVDNVFYAVSVEILTVDCIYFTIFQAQLQIGLSLIHI